MRHGLDHRVVVIVVSMVLVDMYVGIRVIVVVAVIS